MLIAFDDERLVDVKGLGIVEDFVESQSHFVTTLPSVLPFLFVSYFKTLAVPVPEPVVLVVMRRWRSSGDVLVGVVPGFQ